MNPSVSRNNKRAKEHRFVPRLSPRGRGALGLGALGSAALGAGVIAEWTESRVHLLGPWLLGAGVLALLAALLVLRTGAGAIRVGDLGVGFERPDELVRIRWCDLERLRAEGPVLRLHALEQVIAISRAEHPHAVSWILREAIQRIPEKVEIDKAGRPAPSALGDSSGAQLVNLVPLQVTGKTYADTGAAVMIERDALRCGSCAALYHRDAPPLVCSRCGKSLDGNLVPV